VQERGSEGPSPFLSICIPSYNRPELLARLLRSIDVPGDTVEIVICEDMAPNRERVREEVQEFQASTRYRVRYFENTQNLGYDRNLRELIGKARGEFIVFMGDDDRFVPGKLDDFIGYLRSQPDVGYVLRSYLVEHDDGRSELFRYFPRSERFEQGFDTYVLLFRRSVSLAGFTFRRELAADKLLEEFDGTLLFQLYLAAEISLHHPTAFCDVPFVYCEQSFRADGSFFGAAEAERARFSPGKVLPSNSMNFMKGFFRITQYLDRKYGFRSTERVRNDISKYSYPVLAIQRKRGSKVFLQYARTLASDLQLNCTFHFYIYTLGLLVAGEKNCDRLIWLIKRTLGYTPKL